MVVKCQQVEGRVYSVANVWQGQIEVTNSNEEHSQVRTVMMIRLFRCKRELRKRGKRTCKEL